MQTHARRFLDYDPVALVLLLLGISAVLLLAWNI
jgi:hypothetical protein